MAGKPPSRWIDLALLASLNRKTGDLPLTCCNTPHPHRRQFLAATGAISSIGLGLGLGLLHVAPARAHGTEALLLTCMDYRLTDDVARYMDERGMAEKYDHVILAGASLGVFMADYPSWAQTFWDHVDVAIKLHHINSVIVMDHRDCGAYKLAHGAAHAENRAEETKLHTTTLHKLRDAIMTRHPKLKVEILLMALDGSVEAV